MTDRATVWAAVHEERRRLVRDLEGLADARWDTPSSCPGWSVHDVVAHLVESATTTRLGFVRQMVAAGFDFDRANEHGIARHRHADPQRTLEGFRRVVGSTATPPGPLATRLVEAYVHGEDVRRPLGITASYPLAHTRTALDHQVRTAVRFGGGRERVRGVRLVPDDGGSPLGDGAEVRGSTLALLLAVSGRPARPGELTGPGAEPLLART